MRQSVKSAIKTWLEELSGYTVLSSAYATALLQVEDVQELININMLPSVIIDLRKEKRERRGNGSFEYDFVGSIIVLVANVNLDIADEELTASVSEVLDKLFESPTPEVSGKHIAIFIDETSPVTFRQSGEGNFYIAESIPIKINFMV